MNLKITCHKVSESELGAKPIVHFRIASLRASFGAKPLNEDDTGFFQANQVHFCLKFAHQDSF